jgi:hypothetical protein
VAALPTALQALDPLHHVSHLGDNCHHPSEENGTANQVRVGVALPLLRRKLSSLTCCASSHPYRPLYLCLSGYALCLYSSSNFIRRSTFAKREPKPPSSLIQIQRCLGPAVFFDPNTDESTRVENKRMPDGLRIHPTQNNGLASQTTEEPPLKSCRSHLGHLGHGFIASRRYIPVLCRTSIIFLIFLYYHKGERYLITDSNPELPEGLPLEELNSLMGKRLAIKGATMRFIYCNAPVRILVLIYAVHAVIELVYEQIVSLRSISGAAAKHVHDIVQQTEQAA